MSPDQIEQIVRRLLVSMETLSIPVGVSARHIHLSDTHVETLFGAGYTLSKKAELMGGQFACNETVTIVGANLRGIEKVRVLGPTRSNTQVEVSATDAVRLGISPPLRDSGDIQNSAPITVVGPKGAVHLPEGCIIASRHIHMSPGDGGRFGVADGDVVCIKVPGERGGVLDNVKIRIHSTFTLEMHIDTDEANAFGIKTGDSVEIALAEGRVEKSRV